VKGHAARDVTRSLLYRQSTADDWRQGSRTWQALWRRPCLLTSSSTCFLSTAHSSAYIHVGLLHAQNYQCLHGDVVLPDLWTGLQVCQCALHLHAEPYLRGLRVQPAPPPKCWKEIFWQFRKARPAKCERSRTLCLHYGDDRKWRKIKCKKPLGRPGLRTGPRWESLQRSPRPLSWWGGGWLSSFRPHLSPPPNFQPSLPN